MQTQPRNIAFITTARSDYSTMYPVMLAALNETEINTKIFCGGMHLLERFGNTYQQLETDNLPITAKIDFFLAEESPTSLSDSIARGVSAFTRAFIEHQVALIVVSGDRIENLAVLSAATCLRIPVCHISGGDITEGAFDNQIRHAMTKLSHLHMTSMQEHSNRVIQMGEEPWRVTSTGDPALDTIVNLVTLSRSELQAQEGIPEDGDITLCTFHPCTLGSEDFYSQFDQILQFLETRPEIPVITYPNIDPGFERLITRLKTFSETRKDAIIKKSFTRTGYYSTMQHARFMIGNSSSGIWEAPSFHLPCINVGNRQAGRKRADNVIDISGSSLKEFQQAIEIIQSSTFKEKLSRCVNPYGDGNASQKIINIIKNVQLDDKLMMKKFYEINS